MSLDASPTSRPSTKPTTRQTLSKKDTARTRALMNKHGCLLCHTENGQESLGPTFKGLYGSYVTLKSGKKRLRDEAYLKQKILDPASIELAGNRGVMPPFKTTFQPKQLNDIIAYLRMFSTHTIPSTRPKR
ncbi:MAG: hypothetical protein CL920_08185 [Deltaproteobacteria bacterium]|nr:hypothetical protein [Deltaproteobacteria bacterium]